MNINIKTMALSAAAAISVSAFAAPVAPAPGAPAHPFLQRHQEAAPARQLRAQSPFRADGLNVPGRHVRGNVPMRTVEELGVVTPSASFDGLPQFAYLEGPDGNTWFYIAEFKTEEVALFPEFPDYTEPCITSFKFTLYDNLFNERGTIQDRVHLAEGETRAVQVSIDPTVSTKFFNTDDDPEIMVFFAMNTTEYVNHYYYNVYSLGGEKDEDGNNISLMSFEGVCIDAVNAGGIDDEQFYYTFQQDTYINLDDEYDDYIDFMNNAYVHQLTTYAPATDAEGPREVMQKNVKFSCVPGDTTYDLYLISKPFGGKVYMVYSFYEKPFFVDPTGMAEDESATPDNSLIIETYSLDGGKVEKVAQTQVKVTPVEVEDALIYTYLSIGSAAYRYDIDMVENGTPEAPAFIVCVDIQNAALYEELISSGYYVFGADGKMIKPIATDTNGMVLFTDGNEREPQVMFVRLDESGAYTFEFSSLYHGGVDFTIDQDNNGDPISARCDRVPQGDGTYKYAFEMTYYDMDEAGDEYIRVAWYDGKGKFDRIDKVKIGKDVMAAQVNMASSILRPNLFDEDKAMEYAVLVKRSVADQVKNEFMVVDDNGDSFVEFTEDNGRGEPYSFTILFGETNRLMMIYNDNWRFNIDLYDLPFLHNGDESGVVSVETVEGGSVRYYNLQGVEVKNPEKGTVLIRVEGDKAIKVIL